MARVHSSPLHNQGYLPVAIQSMVLPLARRVGHDNDAKMVGRGWRHGWSWYSRCQWGMGEGPEGVEPGKAETVNWQHRQPFGLGCRVSRLLCSECSNAKIRDDGKSSQVLGLCKQP